MEIDGQGIADNHGRHLVTLVADADIRTLKAEHLCKRCFRAARVQHAQATLINRTGIVASHLRSLLQRAAEAVKTADERAADDELVAQIIADLESQFSNC